MRGIKLQIKLNKKRKRMYFLILLSVCLIAAAVPAEAAQKNTWVKISGKTYYYNSKGKKITGLKKIEGKYFFFDKKGILFKKGWKTVKGIKYYFAKSNGASCNGVVKVGKKKYLFSARGRLCGTGIQRLGKKRYYTKKGVLQKGLKTVNGKVYYFTSNGSAKTGWFTYKGSRYYFSPSGAAVTGQQRIAGKTYQFSSKGILQKEKSPTQTVPEKKPDPEMKPEEPETDAPRPTRPVEPKDYDPSVVVPAVEQVENTKEKMEDSQTALNMALMNVSDVEGVNPAELYPIPKEDCEPRGYQVFIEVVEEAKTMTKATNDVLQEDRKWFLAFDPAKGTFVQKQRAFDPANYPYTATELLQEAEKVKAYREQRIVIQAEQVLEYYPEQSRAIFDEINEYRQSKGLKPLIWSENASVVSRLEAGNSVLSYKGTDEEEDLFNFQMHHMSQCGAYKSSGMFSVNECVQGWRGSPNHEVGLSDVNGIFGAVAYYTYNSTTTGVTWNTVIYTVWQRDDIEIYTHASEELWPTILNCETCSEIM